MFLTSSTNKQLFSACILLGISFLTSAVLQAQNNDNDSKLIDEYIASNGNNPKIVFGPENIKQFWTDKSVASKDNIISLYLKSVNNNKWESNTLKIQLANVLETMDCEVDVLTDDSTMTFSVMDGAGKKVLSSSSVKDQFIQYNNIASKFHLEDTNDFSFSLKFSSNKSNILSIQRVILSFSQNNESRYLGSPGFDQLSKEIEEKGISVKNSEVKYIISKEYNKIFLMLPDHLAKTYRYFYHIYPVDKKDLLPGRETLTSNNLDSTLNKTSAVIPKPYNSKNQYTIIQGLLPSYPFTVLRIGQWDSEKGNNARIWMLQFNKTVNND